MPAIRIIHSTSTAVALFAAAILFILSPCAVQSAPPPVHFATGSWPWYASKAISVNPEPPLSAQPAELCFDLVNPTSTGYNVTLRIYYGSFAIGASFTMIGGDRAVYLPPYSNVKECLYWVPPAPGPWSLRAELITPGYDDEVIERNIDLWEELEPFTPDTLQFTVRNSTGSTATISLGLVPYIPGWGLALSPDVIPDLPSGSSQTVELVTTPVAVLPADGVPIVDVTAYIGGTPLGGFQKIYSAVEPCTGARLDLVPEATASNSGTSYEERGAFITAIRGFNVCAIGMEVDLAVPQEVTARIYEAAGTARGALLAEGRTIAVHSGKTFHFVPVYTTLYPCQEYDISFEYGPANNFDYFYEPDGFEPFDIGGTIRVRDGEYNGDASNHALPKLSIMGFAPGDYAYTDLSPEGIEWSSCGDATTDRGVFVTPHHTITLSAMGWETDFSTVPVDITAYVYDGTGRIRGDLIAKGRTTAVTSGLLMHWIPILAVLEEGKEYDLAVTFTASDWSCKGESQFTIPYTAGGILSVNDGEMGGNAANSMLSHFAIEWVPEAGGMAFDLGKTTDEFPPPLISTDSNTNYGLFMTSAIDQEIYSLGWEADVHVGSQLYAWVYEASGTSRGALVSQGSVVAVEGETRWHDIPVAASLEAGADYNIEIGFGQMNQWSFWEDYSGMPYTPYGLFEVYAASQGGSINGHRLIHMRVHACNVSATAVEKRHESPPAFTLYAPYPNPSAGSVLLEYSIDTEGPVTVALYDVAGRRVAVVLDSEFRPAGPGSITIDTHGIAAGVYFVRMEMAAKSVSRRIAIVH